MRLLSARLRDYRLHRDLVVAFDPRFTVISGPNQSGKSTFAEALHRALFLPVRTGGAALEDMKTNPFLADPEVELAFACGNDTWTLRKRFAGSRGSVSLQDGRGHSLQGDAAEERLAQLIGTAAVARNRAAAEQLKERWGHLWVWQGSASDNPLALRSSAYDHDRLVERLQAGADLGVQSPLDLAVLEDIQQRWAEVFTAGGANRAPQVRKGSALQLARAALAEGQQELQAIEASLQEQEEAQQAFEAAAATEARIAIELPRRREERQALEGRLNRSRELQGLIGQERPVLAGLLKELGEQVRDKEQLQILGQRLTALECALAPQTQELAELTGRLPAAERQRQLAGAQLDGLRQATAQCASSAEAIEQRQSRARLQLQLQQLTGRLAAVEELQRRLAELEKGLGRLPVIDGQAVDRLRLLERTVQTARTRAEAMAAGIEVIRAGQAVRLDGEVLPAGTTRMLAKAAVLQVGEDVELRLAPGGGSTAAELQQQLVAAEAAFARELERWKLASLEEAATAERRRSDLLAERERLLEQRGGEDPAAIRRQLASLLEQIEAISLEADSADDGTAAAVPQELDPQALLDRLQLELQTARSARTSALAAEQQQQRSLKESETALDTLRLSIESLGKALVDGQNQLLEVRTRLDAVLERCGSVQALEALIAGLAERRKQSEARLAALDAELAALAPQELDRQAATLDQAITALQQQEREASEARIRAEGWLRGDGRVDLQAEREQKQAELESRLVEVERLEKEARMLNMLRALLEEEQNAMASRYTAPLTERIGTYLGHVFPEAPRAELAYDARGGFGALQWRRGREAAFPFEVLSTGAREQFAAALRVAMAEVLAEAYDGSLPLVFDDAFAHSDRERQAGVHRMLEEAAARGLQVILLTCDPERSGRIAAAAQVRLGAGSE